MENNNSEQNQIISKGLLIFNSFLILSILLVVFAIFTKQNEPKKIAGENETVVQGPVFGEVAIVGKSAYVYDALEDKVLYKKDESTQRPLASITKLMTALTALDLLPKDSDITIRSEFLREEGDSGLVVNESWKLGDLIDFSLVGSSNDGARSVASVIGAFELKSEDYDLGRKEFIRSMNNKAQDLGFSQMYFVNESGLDIGNTSGGYGSAVDVANLVKYILANKPEILEATTFEKIDVSSDEKNHIAKNTNKNISDIPGLIASKTGFTAMAGGNLVVAFDAGLNHPIIVVVLGSTEDERFEDVKKLVDESLNYLAK